MIETVYKKKAAMAPTEARRPAALKLAAEPVYGTGMPEEDGIGAPVPDGAADPHPPVGAAAGGALPGTGYGAGPDPHPLAAGAGACLKKLARIDR